MKKALKKLLWAKNHLTDYADANCMMYMCEYITLHSEGSDIEWENNDTLKMEESNEGGIYLTKMTILNNLNNLLEYRAITEKAVEDVKVAHDLLDIEDNYDYE
jgi:hypothetical protein